MNYLIAIHLAAAVALSAPSGPVQAVQPLTAVRSAVAISYPEGLTLAVRFVGTYRLPDAGGEAKVERKRGMTEIEIELDEMKPAAQFGGDLSTYLLWIVSPEGHTDNAGEFILPGNRSKLNVSTPLQTFGMFVTAEPHFLVRSPSRFIVLRNSAPSQRITEQALRRANIKYRGFEGEYAHEIETLADIPEAKGEIRPDIKQARAAVRLAEQAQADRYAREELERARAALKTLGVLVERGLDRRQVMVAAHDVVRLAVEAQQLAEKRAFQAALGAERRSHADEMARLDHALSVARTQAERARVHAERREMELRMEERARQRLDEELRQTKFRVQSEAAQRELAEARAQKMRELWERDHERLREALGHVADTRQTARGLVVSLPDILFDFDRAALRPNAREVLSKLCGILLVARENAIRIEGHTDSIGTEQYNQALSDQRAQHVRDYLAGCGLAPESITARGLGESQPIASNDDAAGRQQNRRVEVLIQDGSQVTAERRQ